MAREAALLILLLSHIAARVLAVETAVPTSPSENCGAYERKPLAFEIRDRGGVAVLFVWNVLAQLFPAKVTDTFPTNPLLTTSPFSPDRFKLKLADRGTLTEVMPYGGANIPARLRGIWWGDGLGDPTNAIGVGAGKYNAQNRTATVTVTGDYQWGFDASNSTRVLGVFWSLSGAAFFNIVLATRIEYRLVFNEDISFGQIIPTVSLYGIRISFPTSIVSFTMEWVGTSSWRRLSNLLGFLTSDAADYYLRRVFNGDGTQGYWFDKGWLTYNNGRQVAVGYQSYP